MTNANVKTNQAQTATATEKEYFNSILYAKAHITDVRVITPKKGKKYAALSATLLGKNADGKTTYQHIDLIASGKAVISILNEQKINWPSRKDKDSKWIADINIGSLSDDYYISKKGNNVPKLMGRLIKFRSLTIKGETVIKAENTEDYNPYLVAPAYVNLVDIDSGYAKASFLDGEVGKLNYHNISLNFSNIPVFDELNEKGFCPRGYEYREENAKIFSVLVMEEVRAEMYEWNNEIGSCLKGTLKDVRYLKANDEVLTQKVEVKATTEKEENTKTDEVAA